MTRPKKGRIDIELWYMFFDENGKQFRNILGSIKVPRGCTGRDFLEAVYNANAVALTDISPNQLSLFPAVPLSIDLKIAMKLSAPIPQDCGVIEEQPIAIIVPTLSSTIAGRKRRLFQWEVSQAKRLDYDNRSVTFTLTSNYFFGIRFNSSCERHDPLLSVDIPETIYLPRRKSSERICNRLDSRSSWNGKIYDYIGVCFNY